MSDPRTTACLRIARNAFSEIAERFPALQMKEMKNDSDEIGLVLPVQPGLSFEVRLGFQNTDELHLSVGEFWSTWFPCDHPGVTEGYVDTVIGLLAGHYRLVEYGQGKKCVNAKLQTPHGEQWKTLRSWGGFRLPWNRWERELRNHSPQ